MLPIGAGLSRVFLAERVLLRFTKTKSEAMGLCSHPAMKDLLESLHLGTPGRHLLDLRAAVYFALR